MKLAEASGGIAYGTQTFSNGASGATTGQGIVQNYTASIQVGSDQTSKGAEAPSSTKPITFKIDLTGTHTKVDKTTENATVGISYIKDAAGKATVTYVDNGDGTVTVTVSNYEVPELTASSAAPTTLINLTVGVFEGQPQVIPDDEKYEIAIEDTDLSATGVSGESLAAATPGTNDNQTVTTDDNVVTPYEYLTGTIAVTCTEYPGTMVTNNTQTSISMGDSYTETLSPAEGYHNPATVKVTVSGVELTPAADSAADPQPGEYVYDQTTGVVTVPGSSVTGSLVITAEAVKTAKVVSTVTNGSNARGDSEVVDDGTAYDTTFSANDGYALPKTVDVTVGDTTYTIMR